MNYKPNGKSDSSISEVGEQYLFRSIRKIEDDINKNFYELIYKNNKTKRNIEILAYFLVVDILFCFLILGTMRNWF